MAMRSMPTMASAKNIVAKNAAYINGDRLNKKINGETPYKRSHRLYNSVTERIGFVNMNADVNLRWEYDILEQTTGP